MNPDIECTYYSDCGLFVNPFEWDGDEEPLCVVHKEDAQRAHDADLQVKGAKEDAI